MAMLAMRMQQAPQAVFIKMNSHRIHLNTILEIFSLTSFLPFMHFLGYEGFLKKVEPSRICHLTTVVDLTLLFLLFILL